MSDEVAPTTADLLAEIRALRAEVERLRVGQPGAVKLRPTRRSVKGKVKTVVHALETDPDTQYKVHRWGAIYWLINFPVIIYLFFFQQSLWIKLGIFITLVYSIYANLATDYGAMSSALAAKGMKPPPEIPLEEH